MQFLLDVRCEIFHPSDDAKTDVIAEQRVELRSQVTLQQLHERADLTGRTLPVLHRERIQRENLDAQPGRGLDRIANGVDAGPVPFDPGKMALRRPPPVAVHDDGDVHGQPIEVDLADE